MTRVADLCRGSLACCRTQELSGRMLMCGGVRAALVEQIEELTTVERDHVTRAGHNGERILDAQPVQFLAGFTGAVHPLGVVAANEGSDRDALKAFERGKGAGVGRDTDRKSVV